MCTVSIVSHGGALRVVCNRDEQRTRPAALPPRSHRAGWRRGTWPLDPAAGGTWIGVNDAGLVACLLNRHPGPARRQPGPRVSRGTIVPRLLAGDHFSQVLEAAGRIAGEAFEPFTVLVLQGTDIAVLQNHDAGPTLRRDAIRRPLVFTSSSLGDHVVEAPRRSLFRDLVACSEDPLAGQWLFHRHQWRDRPETSVLMSRPDAATVSRTVVDVAGGACSMRYGALTES